MVFPRHAQNPRDVLWIATDSFMTTGYGVDATRSGQQHSARNKKTRRMFSYYLKLLTQPFMMESDMTVTLSRGHPVCHVNFPANNVGLILSSYLGRRFSRIL